MVDKKNHRAVPLTRAFKRLMWWEMAEDRVWRELMDELVHQLPPGKAWPQEKFNPYV